MSASFVRRWGRRFLPGSVRSRLSRTLGLRPDLTEIFSRIYAEGAWGRSGGSFYSGDGSHDPLLVAPYIAAVRRFLERTGRPMSVVDLGCGDFNVGRQLVDLAARYVACDVVPDLIERNRSEFRLPNVRFEVVDIVTDPLPGGDLVFVRQVFQHLSNADIATVVDKLSLYAHWIITEHLPEGTQFTPNLDKPAGMHIRLDSTDSSGSGVVLTAPPFSIHPQREEVLCEVPSYGGVIRTVAYSFR